MNKYIYKSSAKFVIGCLVFSLLVSLIYSDNLVPEMSRGVTPEVAHAADNVISDNRRIDWSTAGANIVNRTNICQTLSPGVTRANINTAITNCSTAGGGVVFLNAGTYSLNGSLVAKNNVTLRGAGVSTILNFTALTGETLYGIGDAAIVIEGGNGFVTEDAIPPLFGAPHGPITWTGTNGASGVYTKGATVLNLSSTPSGLLAGDTIIMAQSDAPNASVPVNSWFMSAKTSGSGTAIADEGSSEIAQAGHHQRSKVISVSGTQVTIDAPGVVGADNTWSTARNPRVWWRNSADDLVHDFGLEDLRMNTTSVGSAFFANISINAAANVWVKGIALSPKTGSSGADFGILIGDSRNVSVVNNWVGQAFGGGSGGNTTTYCIAWKASSFVRVENNVMDRCENAFVPAGAGAGNVILYNFDRWVSGHVGEGGIQPHAPGGMMELAEGNSIQKFWADYFHGPSNFWTIYRNHTKGAGVDFASYNRFNNVVGNVLTGGLQYKTLGNSGEFGRGVAVCFRLGYPGETSSATKTTDSGGGTIVADSVTWTSTMLWGNYCTNGSSTRFLANEVPSTDPFYPNSVPSDQVLPASMIYSSAPSYFTVNGVGTVPWPPIGPDVTGGQYMSGRAYKTAAELMYDFTGGNMANFDPSRYGTSSSPTSTLTIAKSGTGTGTVSGTGINCGVDCTEVVNTGTVVSLTATPSGGSTFAGWSGGGCSGTGSCNVTVSSNTTVTATFNPPPDTTPPTVSISAPAPGATVSGSSVAVTANASDNVGVSGVQFLLDGINLGSEDTTSPYSVTWNSTTASNGSHTLTARARDAAGNNTTSAGVTVTVSAATTFTLTIAKSGTGTGTVSGTGINCGVDCTEVVNTGTVVSLTATPSGGSTFAGWSGGGCSGTGSCNVTVSSNTTVTATFNSGGAPGPYLWSGIIDPVRATDWSKAGATIVNRTTNCVTAACNTLFGGTVTAASIQSALASAPANTVVRIPAGNFSLSAFSFTQSNITLRGAGASQTKLTITNTSDAGLGAEPTAIRMIGGGEGVGCASSCGGPAPSQSATWTAASYAQGTTVLTFSNTSGLVAGPVGVGSLVFLDQTNDGSDGYPALGDLFVCEGTSGGCSEEGGNQWARSGRSQVQPVTVTAINGNQVTVTPGLQMPNWRSSQNPGAWWNTAQIKNSGLEDFALDFSSNGAGGIFIKDATNVWVKNTRLIKTNATGSRIWHVIPFQSAFFTVRDSYFYGPTSQANVQYAFTPNIAGQFVFENNILQKNTTPIAANDPSHAGVYSYNFIRDTFYTSGIQPHNAGDFLSLYEGNNLNSINGENIHGPHYMSTHFRNHHDGYTNNGQGAVTNCAMRIASKNRFWNIIGNVIGHSHFTTYQVLLTDNDNSVYCLGNTDDSPSVDDPHVERTLMRWGNWDNVTSTNDTGTNDTTGTRFVSSEVPSGINSYFNSVPASQVLPASFYLPSQPSWWTTPWGTPKWPAIGPDVSNGNATNTATSPTGGHADKIPARLCFENTADDPAYASSNPRIKLFEASSCYGIGGGGGDTTPPNNVSVTAPTAGATVSGISVTVSANASDNIGVVGVQFLLDGVNLGSEDTTSPYSITWNSTTASNGAHTITARARDAAGNQTTSAGISVTVNTAVSTFTLTVTKSGTGTGTVTGTGISCGADCTEVVNSGTSVTLTAAASGGSTFASWSGGGCSGTGSCNVTVSANTTVTATFNIQAANQPPVGSFDEIRLSDGVVRGWSYDPDATSTANQIHVYIDGPAGGGGTLLTGAATNVLRTDVNSTFGISGNHGIEYSIPAAYRNGVSHSIYLYGVDTSNPAIATLLAGSPKNFTLTTVDGTAPTVSITAPSNGATVSGASITVTANASDNVGVVGVQFLLDGANLGAEDASSPYSITWNTTTASNGAHTITARARDAAGNQTTSSGVNVTVNNPTAKFVIGDRVIANGDGVYARATPSLSGTILQLHPVGALGTVIGGPTTANSIIWWQIDYDTGSDGWSTEPNIDKYTATPVVGDINNDHIVNSIDYSLLNADWFTNDPASDLNHDGIVNAIDYSILNSNWFKTW